MKRRDFLQSMLGLAMAPAIVQANNIMKIYVPKKEILVSSVPIVDLGVGDFTIEFFIRRAGVETPWVHCRQTQENGVVSDYLDGVLASPNAIAKQYPDFLISYKECNMLDDGKPTPFPPSLHLEGAR